MSQTQAVHTDSIDGQDHNEGEKKAKSRRPASEIAKPTVRTIGVGELTRYSELRRYCIPATASQSVAVSVSWNIEHDPLHGTADDDVPDLSLHRKLCYLFSLPSVSSLLP